MQYLQAFAAQLFYWNTFFLAHQSGEIALFLFNCFVDI